MSLIGLIAIGIDFEVGFLLFIALRCFGLITFTGLIRLSINFQSIILPSALISIINDMASHFSLILNCDADPSDSLRNSSQLFPRQMTSPLSLRNLSSNRDRNYNNTKVSHKPIESS